MNQVAASFVVGGRQDIEDFFEFLYARIAELEAAIAEDHFEPPPAWRLTKTEIGVLQVLLARKVATREALMAHLYSLSHGREPPEAKVLDIHICRLRKKLARYSIPIETRHGRGWALADDAKYAVRAARTMPAAETPATDGGIWTEDRITGLKTLWHEGFSGAVIAERLGLGRDGKAAVFGKAYRLGLPLRRNPDPEIRPEDRIPSEAARRLAAFDPVLRRAVEAFDRKRGAA